MASDDVKAILTELLTGRMTVDQAAELLRALGVHHVGIKSATVDQPEAERN